jgi:hypothetical protein
LDLGQCFADPRRDERRIERYVEPDRDGVDARERQAYVLTRPDRMQANTSLHGRIFGTVSLA